jgi:hypothetical protein
VPQRAERGFLETFLELALRPALGCVNLNFGDPRPSLGRNGEKRLRDSLGFAFRVMAVARDGKEKTS